jgi:hypothetical protein
VKSVPPSVDRYGDEVVVGMRVRLIRLSESLLRDLPKEEVADLQSMVGAIFEITEIDQYGKPWIGKGWSSPEESAYKGHSLALEPDDFEIVNG